MGDKTRLEVYRKDARIVRNIDPQPFIKRPRSKRQDEAQRGKIKGLSAKSAANCLFYAKNAGPWSHFATLNFGPVAPSDHVETRRYLDRILTWLGRRQNSVLWKIEFSLSGRPHFHLLLKRGEAYRAMLLQWACILGEHARPNMLKIGMVRRQDALPWYTAKRSDDPQNWVPPGYENMGRFWGCRGPEARPQPLLIVEGPAATVAPLARTVKKISTANGRRRFRDGGAVSKKLYDGGGESVARAVALQAGALGIEVAKAAEQKRRRRSAKKAPGGSKDMECRAVVAFERPSESVVR